MKHKCPCGKPAHPCYGGFVCEDCWVESQIIRPTVDRRKRRPPAPPANLFKKLNTRDKRT